MDNNNGTVLLSWVTMLALGLIQLHTRYDYLPPRASLITSSADHPKRIKSHISVHISRKKSEVSSVSNCKGMVPKLITSKEQILAAYSDVFHGIGCFPGPQYQIKVDSSVTPKKTPCQLVTVHLKKSSKKEVHKMFQARVLKPVHQATPWINSSVLVEGKDKLGNLKLRICLDPTNLNSAWAYHFKVPEDIAHQLAEAYIITVYDFRKSNWYHQLDETSSFFTTFNTELDRLWYAVMPFGATVASHDFWHS